jgi:hypothetical protein
MMVPKLRVVQEMERGVCHLLVIWRPVNTKIVLATVQPWERIAGPVKLRKVEFVVSWKEVVVVLVVLWCEVVMVRRHRTPRFHPGQMCDRVVLARVPIHGAAIGDLQCGRCLFAAVGLALALLQANQRDAHRLLLLIDVTHLCGERANEFLQTVELCHHVRHRRTRLLPRTRAISGRHGGRT